jgi:hypothetical protein
MADSHLQTDLRILHDAIGGEVETCEGSGASDRFTRPALDHLIEIGRVEDGEVASWEGPAGRGLGRVDAYGIGEQKDTLDLFITDLGSV